MDHWPSLLFVWWSAACLFHSLTIKIFAEAGIDIFPSLIFNFHVLLALSLIARGHLLDRQEASSKLARCSGNQEDAWIAATVIQ